MSSTALSLPPHGRRVLRGALVLLAGLALLALAIAADSMLNAMIASAATPPAPSAASSAGVERFTLTATQVAIYNLAGKVNVEAGTGKTVEIEMTRGGRDAEQLRVQNEPIRGRQTLSVIYPGTRIIYPEMGRGSNTEVNVDDDGCFGGSSKEWGLTSRRKVRISGSGTGLEAHADLRVKVPAGQKIAVYLGVGWANVANVNGELLVDVCSADIAASGTRGKLTLDTGSGEIQVRDAQGELSFDTGSGDVNVSRVQAGSLHVDTGSGTITGSDLVADELSMDTGSGDIRVSGVKAPEVALDTGSGSVELGLTADIVSLAIDTGSGDVVVRIPDALGAEVSMETGSGDIDSDVPFRLVHRGDDSMRGTIGDGRGRMVLETGSGSIRLASY